MVKLFVAVCGLFGIAAASRGGRSGNSNSVWGSYNKVKGSYNGI